ncbi:MAG: metallophosphoesterase [Lautropia sp.]
MTQGLVEPLFTGPLDLVGDIHGELDALHALLARLGYDRHGEHRHGRRLVFVGDLCDRGPDSPGVVRFVQRLVERELAQCLLGNHELNLLRGRRKHGNHWFFGETSPALEAEFGVLVPAGDGEADALAAFMAQLPIALERADLRVVHAAWLDDVIAACRGRTDPALDAHVWFDRRALASASGARLKAARDDEYLRHAAALTNPGERPPLLPALAAYDEHRQMSNPVRIATSGVERVTARPFFAGGKWRFVERVPWWRDYDDPVPVVFGHYWRCWDPAGHAALSKGEPNLFEGDAPDGWQRNAAGAEVAICIDYSVGARFKERRTGRRAGFAGRLAALRWPERTLVFDADA